MSFVKEIALTLNLLVPLYFFLYRLFQEEQESITQNLTLQQEAIIIQSTFYVYFTKICYASLVLISPLFHILALITPSYCQKGHCPPPHHYKKTYLQDHQHSTEIHPYQPLPKQLKNISSQSLSKLKFNDDLIQESDAYSSKQELNLKQQKDFYHKKQKCFKLNDGNKKDQYTKQKYEYQSKISNQSPLKIRKLSSSYSDLHPPSKKLIEANNNVNQFSNIPFLRRSSRKSLSNIGNNQSPRYSRRSVVQISHQQRQRNQLKQKQFPNTIIEPLIKLTPIKSERKQNKYQQEANKDKIQLIHDVNLKYQQYHQDSSNRKQCGDINKRQDQTDSRQFVIGGDRRNDDQKIIHQRYRLQHQNQFLQKFTLIECEVCEQCQLPKYLRMKHCYRCNKCVHKYDHHCVLLNICIGEQNQKYYIAFLYAHFYNTCIVLLELLTDIKSDVTIDMATGIEQVNNFYVIKALCIILLLLNFVLTTYLVVIHTGFLLTGMTTYEKERKLTINYFKYIRKNFKSIAKLKHLDKEQVQNYHPFDEGVITNVYKVIKASKQPYDWKLPFQDQKQIIQMTERKQMAKNIITKNQSNRREPYEWGQQSQSSNYLHAGKTTKSRQSGLVRKSKQNSDNMQKNDNKNICR